MSNARSTSRASFGRALRRVVFGSFAVALLVVAGTSFRVWQVAKVDQARQADMILVLGAAQYNGDPSAVLEARLRHALKLYEQGYSEHIVTVGGNQAGDNYTEAQASRMWLTEHGVPAQSVTAVEVGYDTLSSISAAASVAEQRGWGSVLIVSDPWHSWRCRTMATDLGLRAWVSPTRTSPLAESSQTRRHYILRETAAMLYYRLMHASSKITGTGLG